jgi:hypothetical protein
MPNRERGSALPPAPPDQHPPTHTERGSAMLLVPAALIIVALMAALTIDSAHAFLMQRELAATADAMANDAIAAIDADRVYTGDTLKLYADGRLEAIIAPSRTGRVADEVVPEKVVVRRIEDAGIEVELTARVRPYFSRILRPANWTIRARARAYPVADEDG